MRKLDDVPVTELQTALDRAEEGKAVKRLMIALAYRHGTDVETLSERYDIPESTIYYWLDRFESEPIERAVTDDPKPGRPPKLSDEQRTAVAEWVTSSPREQGLDAREWTPALLREQIRTEFGVEYSEGHVRRLLDELS